MRAKDLLPKSEAPDVPLIGFKCTDYGNSERLVARYRDRIRYCPPRRCWFVWDGRRWARDDTGEIVRFAKKTTRAIYGEAEQCTDDDVRKAIAKHARDSEKGPKLREMVTLAQSEPGVPVLPGDLDGDPWLFNCANVTIDLRTGDLREHHRGDLITKIAPVTYSAEARSDLWERFLADATGSDAELAAYLQRSAGYALQGTVTEKVFWFLFGKPDGMKSTFIDAISGALGDYAATAAFTTWLVQTSTGGNRGDIVSLFGARLVTSVECRKGARFDEETLKRVTGGDEMKAAAKYEAEIAFKPTFALWLAGNDAPIIRDDDAGAWSRVRRIPFTNPLPKEKQDPLMREKLRAPEVQAAILAWAVRGCIEWQRSGLGTCAAVERSSAAYRNEMDRAAGFFDERCAFGGIERVLSGDLRAEYEDWCREQGVRVPLSGKDFAARLLDRGCTSTRSHGRRFWNGVRLLGDDEEGAAGATGGQQFLELPHEKRSVGGFLDLTTPADTRDTREDDEERDAIQNEGGE